MQSNFARGKSARASRSPTFPWLRFLLRADWESGNQCEEQRALCKIKENRWWLTEATKLQCNWQVRVPRSHSSAGNPQKSHNFPLYSVVTNLRLTSINGEDPCLSQPFSPGDRETDMYVALNPLH